MERSDLTKKDVKTIVVFQFCTETYIYMYHCRKCYGYSSTAVFRDRVLVSAYDLMTDFVRLNDMVASALPFVREWATDDTNHARLEVCLAGVSAVAFHLASKYHWSLIAVLCSLAAKVLISDDAAQSDLDPAGWIKERAHPASVVTFVSSLPDAQAHLLVFQLSAALSLVTDWATSQSPLLKPEDHLLFKHLRAMLFDLLTSARLGAGGLAVDQLIDSLPNRMSASPEN